MAQILREEHFPHVVDSDNPRRSMPSDGNRPNNKLVDFPEGHSGSEYEYDEGKPQNISRSDESATMASDGVFSPCTSDDDDDSHQQPPHRHPEPSDTSIISDGNMTEHNEDDSNGAGDAMEKGIVRSKSHEEEEEEVHVDDTDNNINNSSNASEENEQNIVNQRKSKTSLQHNPYGDEDSIFIKIPVPGLPLDGSSLLDPTKPQHDGRGAGRDDREMRLAPGLCTICLSNYKVCAYCGL